jgi:hypothetical protein
MLKMAIKGIRRDAQAQMVADFRADMKAANGTESKARKAFKKDTEHMNTKFSLVCLAQRAEFLDWINGEFEKAGKEGRRLSDFFTSMRTKLICADALSENMVNALRKCKDRPALSEVKKDAKTVVLTLKIKKFLQKQLELDSRVITGVVKCESAKAYLMEGHADMLSTMSWCMRCGKGLTQPASYTIGFGET